MNNSKVIVVVGPIASGKGAVISSLQALGHKKLSLSDEIRKKFHKLNPKKIPLRNDLQDLGDLMRKKFGNYYWAQKVGNNIKKTNNFVIDSVRNPEEVIWLKKNHNAIVIAVNVTKVISIKRAIARARDIDPTTNLIELKNLIKRDLGINQPEYGQQVKKCIALADIKISNNGSVEEFESKLKKVFRRLNLVP